MDLGLHKERRFESCASRSFFDPTLGITKKACPASQVDDDIQECVGNLGQAKEEEGSVVAVLKTSPHREWGPIVGVKENARLRTEEFFGIPLLSRGRLSREARYWSVVVE